jgi:hypothetical protein
MDQDEEEPKLWYLINLIRGRIERIKSLNDQLKIKSKNFKIKDQSVKGANSQWSN